MVQQQQQGQGDKPPEKWEEVRKKAKKKKTKAKQQTEKPKAEESQKPRRKRRFRRRKEAFQISPAAGKSYEETLLELKRSVNLEESGTRVHWIRKTQNGSVLIELEAIEDRH